MSWDNRGNSRSAWEQAFRPGEHWDEVDGDGMTEQFAVALLEHLPPEVVTYLSQGRRVLDWGCARGQLTNALRESFPNCYVAGMDISALAVTQAAKRYGGPFIWSPTGELEADRWDVLVASNILEHMLDPFGVMERQMKMLKGYYIALSPCEESMYEADWTPEERAEAGCAHVQRFGKDSFPETIGSWARIQSEVFYMNGPWSGEQVQVTYRA